MCSARKSWPARMVAAMMTLALVLACTLAAYDHAAGHPHSAANAAQSGLAHSFDADSGPGHLHAGHGHEDGAADESGCATGCCNIMCAGCAILVAAAVIEHPVAAAPATELAVLRDSAEPSGLERPPKASVPA